MFGNNKKSSGSLSVTIVFPVWAVNISTFKVQLTCMAPCCQTTARRRRSPRSVLGLKVLVVFLVESKYHLESYHPSEIIKFTS